MRKGSVEKVIEVFGIGKAQDFLTIKDFMNQSSVTDVELREFLRKKKEEAESARKKRLSTRHAWERLAPKCPECGAPLALRRIDIPAGRGNEKGYLSQWFCLAADCVYERYSTMSAVEQLKRYGLYKGGA